MRGVESYTPTYLSVLIVSNYTLDCSHRSAKVDLNED